LILEKEIDQRNIDRNGLQSIDGFAGGLKWASDFRAAALQLAGMIGTDDRIVLSNKNANSFKVLDRFGHSSALLTAAMAVRGWFCQGNVEDPPRFDLPQGLQNFFNNVAGKLQLRSVQAWCWDRRMLRRQ
jgi:hypothetical protein